MPQPQFFNVSLSTRTEKMGMKHTMKHTYVSYYETYVWFIVWNIRMKCNALQSYEMSYVWNIRTLREKVSVCGLNLESWRKATGWLNHSAKLALVKGSILIGPCCDFATRQKFEFFVQSHRDTSYTWTPDWRGHRCRNSWFSAIESTRYESYVFIHKASKAVNCKRNDRSLALGIQ